MKILFIAMALLIMTEKNKVAAQADSTQIMMSTFMAKNPGGNASPANISMWPNPARGSVNVYFNTIRPGDRGQCVVYNDAGISCVVGNLSNGSNRIYLGSLKEGLYYMHIRLHNNIVFAKKLIVSR